LGVQKNVIKNKLLLVIAFNKHGHLNNSETFNRKQKMTIIELELL